MGGLTKRKKLQAYLSDEVAKKFDEEWKESGLTESKLIEKILAERYRLAELANELAINPGIEGRLEYLETHLSELIESNSAITKVQELDSSSLAQLSGRIQALTDCHISLEKLVVSRLREVEESTESLNQLCKFFFESAFNRIGRLERGERVNDLALDESAANSQDDLAKAQESMVKLAKNFNASEVTVTVSLDEGMSLKQVAEYLGLNDKRLIKTRKEKGDHFLEYLQQKSGKVWEFDPEADRHGKYRIVAESAATNEALAEAMRAAGVEPKEHINPH